MVQPVRVVEALAVPLLIAGRADAVMVLVTVGIAVPDAIFHTSKVIVPVSTVAAHSEIVQANGTKKYAVAVDPEVKALPPPSNPAPTARARVLAVTAGVYVPPKETVAAPEIPVPLEKVIELLARAALGMAS